jgi:hypothetical protein
VALKQLSAAKYGRPKAIVEHEINERMLTKGEALPGGAKPSTLPSATPASSFNQPAASSLPAASTSRPPSAAPAAGGSFLDEWLNKRRRGVTPPPTAPAAAAPAYSPPPLASPSPLPAAVPANPVPQAPPPPASQPTALTRNISSNELENSEVNEIAAEIKQELGTSKLTASTFPPTSSEPEPKPAKTTEHSVDLGVEEGDTIFIDRDGTFRKAEPKPKSN